MPELHTLLGFFGVAVLLALSPGPDNLFVLVQSAQRGWRAGIAVVIGLCLGLVLQTAAVALGLAALLMASATAFNVLKACGALYLLYLAWGAFTAMRTPASINMAALAKHKIAWQDSLRMIARGVVMNITNPKVLVFFIAFLPQFTNPALGSVAVQICVFGALFILATLIVFGAIAIFSGAFGAALQRSARVQAIINGVAGLIFVGLAINLLLARR